MPVLAGEYLTIGGTIAGRFHAGSFSAVTALSPTLGIRVQVRLDVPKSPVFGDPVPDSFELVQLTGEIRLSETGPLVGFLSCRDRRVDVRTGDGERTIELACQLDRLTLERIEQLRGGGPPEFWLELSPRIEASGMLIRNASLRGFRVPVSRDEWVTFLEASGYEEHAIFDLRIPKLSVLDFDGSARYLVAARERLLAGDSNGCVAECRKALECIGAEGEPEKSKLVDLLEPLKGSEQAKALRSLASALKRLTNAVVHSRNEAVQFSRSEARLLLLSTAGLVEVVCEISTCASS